MALYRNKYRIESARLQRWDYSASAYYFITICVKNRRSIFGSVENNTMNLNRYGKIVYDEWGRTFSIRGNVIADDFVVMPNHFHAIVHIDNGTNKKMGDDPIVEKPCHGPNMITGNDSAETPRHGVSIPQYGKNPQWKSGVLGAIIGQFKQQVTKKIRKTGLKNFSWQTRFHDHIVRNEQELFRIRQYIRNNPAKWDADCFFNMGHR
ncbi:transposase [Chitinispirillum alkaliphilum]|nr:transposase [Chitinispirillum alkaliphilum]